jgi:hypothetical protein
MIGSRPKAYRSASAVVQTPKTEARYSGPLAPPAATSMQSTITGVLAGLESANNNFVANMTYAFSSAYATLLPTADIATALCNLPAVL